MADNFPNMTPEREEAILTVMGPLALTNDLGPTLSRARSIVLTYLESAETIKDIQNVIECLEHIKILLKIKI